MRKGLVTKIIWCSLEQQSSTWGIRTTGGYMSSHRGYTKQCNFRIILDLSVPEYQKVENCWSWMVPNFPNKICHIAIMCKSWKKNFFFVLFCLLKPSKVSFNWYIVSTVVWVMTTPLIILLTEHISSKDDVFVKEISYLQLKECFALLNIYEVW